MFNREAFERLAAVEADPAITLYLPTHRAGQETHNGHDRIAFKDALKEVRRQLEAAGAYDRATVDDRLERLGRLDDATGFWRHQSDTLAVFLGEGDPEYFTLPITVPEPRVAVGPRFLLTPAAAMLRPEARYYVFCLAMGENAFYEATRHTITSVFIADEVPADLEEVLEPYVGSESLQWHSAGGTGTGAIFHGQGSNEDRQDEREEIYFTEVSRGLDRLLAGQREPLVLVCDAQYDKALRASLKYPHVYAAAVHTDPTKLGMPQVHTLTWQAVQGHFDRDAAALRASADEAAGAGRVAAGLGNALPAAVRGQVDTLFLAAGQAPVWGAYDAERNAVRFDDARGAESVDLVEQAIRQTVAQGGEVVVRPAEALPEALGGIGATLRYTL